MVRFADDLVMYLDDERWQDALKHSGIIVPVRHAETVFDLTADEVAATFRMLAQAKDWLDREHAPDGYNVGWNSGAVAGQQVFEGAPPARDHPPLVEEGALRLSRDPVTVRVSASPGFVTRLRPSSTSGPKPRSPPRHPAGRGRRASACHETR